MRRAAIVAVRDFTERMARRFERIHSAWQEGAELLRNATPGVAPEGLNQRTRIGCLGEPPGVLTRRILDNVNEPGPSLMRQSNTRAASVEAGDSDRPSH
jgi:hypothetical protein